MPHVKVTDAFEGRAAGAGDEVHGLADPLVGTTTDEERLVGRLVDQVGRDDHRVGAQQYAKQVEHNTAGGHEREGCGPAHET